MAKIKIKISKGEITSEIEGIKGSSCAGIDKFLNKLGSDVETKQTGEFFEDGQDNDVMINSQTN